MYLSSILATAGLCVAAAVPRQADDACTNPPKRVEWRTLSANAQKHYIDSVLCLTTKPSGLGHAKTSRYDDFTWVHTNLDKEIHFVAQFLPWHRLFVQAYEDALHDCGFVGVMPYWDWTLDTDDVTKSPIWDPETGFGGNGDPAIDPFSGDRKCLVDGPLKGLQVNYTMSGLEPHCLARNWNSGIAWPGDMLARAYTKEAVQKITVLDTYQEFHPSLEAGPHGAIHSAVGGDMSPATSPNDPLFFLHHTQIDRLWTSWQQENPEQRTMDFGGPKKQGDGSPEATLEDTMRYLGLIPEVKVKDVMSTQTSRLCYTY